MNAPTDPSARGTNVRALVASNVRNSNMWHINIGRDHQYSKPTGTWIYSDSTERLIWQTDAGILGKMLSKPTEQENTGRLNL